MHVGLHEYKRECTQVADSARRHSESARVRREVHALTLGRLQASAIARKQSGLHACPADSAHAERAARMRDDLSAG